MSQVRRKAIRTRPQAEPIALMVKARSGLRVSAEAFWRICGDNPELRLERTARGALIVMSPAGSDISGRNARLAFQLARWAEADASGIYFESSAGFTLPNGAVRSPDASWILLERWEALSAEQKRRFAPICPDFVVELLSPSDEGRRPRTREKMREYIEQGARLGWLIDPGAREVEIYRPGRAAETLAWPSSLSGEDVLPGFVLDLSRI